MRICLITSAAFPPAEGLGFHVWNLARGLVRAGHQVHIITRGGAQTHTEQVAGEGFTLSRVRYFPLYPLHVHVHGVFVNGLLRRLAGQFDVINEHAPLPPVVNSRLPLVTTVHSPMRSDTAATSIKDLRTLLVRLQTPVSGYIEEQLFARSAAITTVAQWVADALASYGVDPDRVTVTGNGVEDRFFDARPALPREPLVLYAGRVEIGKGLEELVRAARIVADCAPDWPLRFVVAGGGPLLPKIQALVAAQGLTGRFDFTGHLGPAQRDRLVQLYRTAGVFVLPSYHEGLSTVMLEAMAAGAPVVSTAVGGALEVIRDGENGRLVPPRDAQAIAGALLALWADPEQRAALGAHAQATVAERYSWPAITAKYLEVYRQAIEQGGLR